MYQLEPHWTWKWCSVANVSWEQFLYYTEPVRWVSIQREETNSYFQFFDIIIFKLLLEYAEHQRRNYGIKVHKDSVWLKEQKL